MVSLAIFPKSKADSDKIGGGFSRLMAVDPTFKMKIDQEFNETIVSGIGEIHLELMLERLKERYGVEVEVGKPRIPYRETVRRPVKVQGKYKKQSGGRGQYGDCWIELSPLSAGSGFEFTNSIFGGAIPSKYVPAIEKGVRDTMQKGTLAGYPVVDIKVDVYDGSYHDVDSSDMAFQIAGSMAFKLAEEQANPILLEPIMNIEVTVPQSFMGDITSDISSRRGRVAGMDAQGDVAIVKAQVPLAELYKYSTSLRSMTSGAASHTMSFSHYEQIPAHIAQKVIDEGRKAKETAAAEKK
jgi:elongation factor G